MLNSNSIRKSKFKNMNFYKMEISDKEGKVIDIPKKMLEIINAFDQKEFKKIPELDFDDLRIFIEIIKPNRDLENGDYPIYVMNTCTVDKNKEIELGDLSKDIDKRKEILKRNRDTGVLNDTQYVIDPHRRIICTITGRGRNTIKYTNLFIKELFDIKSLKLNPILSEEGYSSLSNISINEFYVNIASPDHFSDGHSDSNSVIEDLKEGKVLNAESIKIKFSGKNLKRRKIIEVIKGVIKSKNSNKNNVKSVRVSGTNDEGLETSIDFIKNRLNRKVQILYTDKETVKDYCDAMLDGYKRSYIQIKKLFEIK